MGLFDGMNNPWAPGGQMASRSPWAQPGREQGWGQGDSSQSGLTQAERQEQEDLQLAIQAATAVAPEVVADERRAGGGQQVESDGEYGQSGSGQTPVLDSTQSQPRPQTSGGDDTSASAPSWGGHFFSMETFLAPFLHPEAAQVLQTAARGGELHLNDALHRLSGNGLRGSHSGLQGGLHFSIPVLVGLTEAIGRDAGLRHELRRMGSRGVTGLSRPAYDRVSRLVRENLPQGVATKALESVLDVQWPKRKPKMTGPVGIIADPNSATVNGTVYLEFDRDFAWGEEDPEVTMNMIAYEVQDSICTKLQANKLGDKPIISNIRVVPILPGDSPPDGAHVFKIGDGSDDEGWKTRQDEDKQSKGQEENPRISWVNRKRGRKGYLYETGDAGHETMHWLGLSDRYTEVIHIDGKQYSNSDNPIRVQWGRPSFLFLPLANVQGAREALDYDPLTNVMSKDGLTLTQFQLGIIFSNKEIEREYARDVVAVGPYVEDFDMPDFHDHKVEEAVEFVGHEAIWWYVVQGSPQENRPKRPSEYTRAPSTIRRLGNIYFGQNFHAIRRAVYDRDRTQDNDSLGERIRENRKEVNKAIQHNQ